MAINQFYAPDQVATAQLLRQLCEDLVSGGDEVTVLASRASYLGGAPLPRTDQIAGVEVVRPASTHLGRDGVWRRICDDASFLVSAVVQAASRRRPDVLLVLSSPAMLASGAALVSAARGIPLVCWVHDVYPDVIEALAGSSIWRRHALWPLHQLAGASLRQAERVVALSPGMATRLGRHGLDPRRMRVISNWADGRLLAPIEPAHNRFRARHQLADRFVVMYSGTLGRAHDVATLIEAARLLEQRCPRLLMLFVGGGARWSEARQSAADLGNIRWLPPEPASELAHSLSAAQLHLVSLREGMEGLVVPSKLYGVLAVGRPLVYVGPASCELARVISEHQLGWVVSPGDAHKLADVICEAAADEIALARRGAAARQLFSTRFDRPLAVARWRGVLAEAAGRAMMNG